MEARSLFRANESVTRLCPPNYIAQITGASAVFYKGKRFGVVYLDGKCEEARLSKSAARLLVYEDGEEHPTFMSCISAVQSMRSTLPSGKGC